MLEPCGSCAKCSTLTVKCSGFSCMEMGYRRTERCEASLGISRVEGLAIVAFGRMSFESAFVSIPLPSLHVSRMSLAVFTIALLKLPAGNESCCTVSADGPQPLRVCGHSGMVRQLSWQPGSSKTTQHQARSGHNTDHT